MAVRELLRDLTDDEVLALASLRQITLSAPDLIELVSSDLNDDFDGLLDSLSPATLVEVLENFDFEAGGQTGTFEGLLAAEPAELKQTLRQLYEYQWKPAQPGDQVLSTETLRIQWAPTTFPGAATSKLATAPVAASRSNSTSSTGAVPVPGSSLAPAPVSIRAADSPPAHNSRARPDSPRFARELILPLGSADDYKEVAEAIVQEHRACAEWKRLRCIRVECIDRDEGLFRLETGGPLGLESNWEGSTALRPRNGDGSPSVADANDDTEQSIWQGPVVEADDTRGTLFVAVESEHAPVRGGFYVRPFEFTALLKSVYTDSKYAALRLLLCSGGLAPLP